jgi:hypothetical protein
MSARNLKKKSETDWARIDRMTDDEIDTSDIPPLDDDFFKSAKWLLPRWYIDLGDFQQAQAFAQHILRRKWRHDKKEGPVTSLEHQAFNTSLIVAYARPFHKNKNFKGATAPSLRNDAAKVLNGPEGELHNRILTLRDNVYAHSAAAAHRVPNWNYALPCTPILPVENLREADVRLLKSMIKKWIVHLKIERSKFRSRLAQAVRGDGYKIAPVQNRPSLKS